MATVEIKVPAVGESIVEGTIARWLKKDGDAVQAEEPIFELETEKATQEIPAPAGGTLRINAQEGQTVAVGAVVGQIDTAAAAKKGAPASGPAAKTQAAEKAEPKAPEKAEPKSPERNEKPLSPAVRRIAAENQVDVNQI